MDDKKFKALPNEVESRARELNENGLSPMRSVSIAAHQLKPGSDWTFEDIANVLNIDENVLSSHRSKAHKEIENAAKLLIQNVGKNRVILAEQEPKKSRYPFEREYIVSCFYRNDQYKNAKSGDTKVAFIRICSGSDSGQSDINLEMETESFGSLETLADEKYRNMDSMDYTELCNRRDILIQAGISEESLVEPGDKLPPSHPDSSDHFQYQMQSIEKDPGR